MAKIRRACAGSCLVGYRKYFMAVIVFVEIFIATGPAYAYNVLFASIKDEFNAGAALTGNRQISN